MVSLFPLRAVVSRVALSTSSRATEKPRVVSGSAPGTNADSGVEVGSSSAPPRGSRHSARNNVITAGGTAGASTSVFEMCFKRALESDASKPTTTVISAREYGPAGAQTNGFDFAFAFDAVALHAEDAVSLTNVAPRTRITAACAFGSGSASTSVSSTAPATVFVSFVSFFGSVGSVVPRGGCCAPSRVVARTPAESGPERRVAAASAKPPTGPKDASDLAAVCAVAAAASRANSARCTVAPPIAATAPPGSAALTMRASAAAR